MTDETAHPRAAPTVTTLAATAIVVADMVGVGVFTSLGFQVKDISSGFVLLLLWFVGGVVALCGAFCYAELAAMFPRSSGEYNFLTRCYNPAVGFLAGWLSATVGFAAPVALAAMAFGQYAKAVLPGASPLLLGLAVIWIVTAVHLRGTRHGSAFQVGFTLLKLALILAFVVAGFARGGQAGPQAISFAPSLADPAQVMSAAFAISLVFVMYAYSGWNAATYIVGEIKDPQRSLPRALFLGTGLVLVLYVALNAVFLYTTPVSELAGQVDVALIAGRHVFGEEGARVVGALICAGLVPTIGAMMWIGPRVTLAMGEDVGPLRIFARRSRNGAPVPALLLQCGVASLLLLTQSFEAVLDFIQFSLTFCSFLAVLGLMKLRITRPDLPRPYRAWGYPVTPMVFLSVTLFMMIHLVAVRPIQSLAGFLIMLAGLLLYAVAMAQPQGAPRKALS
ncbi:APC family permease [Methylobacterium nonmethylotrophicum]|uniref:Amino acid permease n=1 Tax=Methylobacterium nonmethylotrophicum TaxID=1141884 RepID=A0A4Z0NHR7_9HYPH|nr:amino acid permease [Methylobacterium nonmethylotrophicum]TGD95773.1 amino acid permease [Methylobacterium nonmethylotrophicum]